jgi:cob(I)alamin adenosyltransferase
MKITTKTGDNMTTGAIYKRVYKDDPLIECLGTIDEFQANLMNATHLLKDPEIKRHLEYLVNKMFLFGEDLIKFDKTQNITFQEVNELEDRINHFEKALPEQHEFLLPGKTLESSVIHVARTIARRLERRVITYGREVKLRADLLAYINRLSDLLYIYARVTEEL